MLAVFPGLGGCGLHCERSLSGILWVSGLFSSKHLRLCMRNIPAHSLQTAVIPLKKKALKEIEKAVLIRLNFLICRVLPSSKEITFFCIKICYFSANMVGFGLFLFLSRSFFLLCFCLVKMDRKHVAGKERQRESLSGSQSSR